MLERIGELVIPPAWKDVWICPYPMGHIQATGIDARGRKQYVYHRKWRERRDQEKFDEMVRFAKCLPKLRQRASRDLGASRARPEARPRLRRAAARPRVLPHRRRGLRRVERLVRARDDAQGARHAHRARTSSASTTRRRAASAASSRSSTTRSSKSSRRSSAAAAAVTSSRPTRRDGAGWTSAPRTSTATSRRSRTRTSPRKRSAPGTPPCWPPSRSRFPVRPDRARRPPASAPSRAP